MNIDTILYRRAVAALLFCFLTLVAGCEWLTPSPTEAASRPPSQNSFIPYISPIRGVQSRSEASGPKARFAVIGDFGAPGKPAEDVAELAKSWNPDFIVTVGDNNYPKGAAETIEENIGKYYSGFIRPYAGVYGTGANENRFFPVLGNHDWDTAGAAPYLDYFALPGNERYYVIDWGELALFALDSDPREPDGTSVSSRQAQWLKEELKDSNACWKLVYMHHPPFSSGRHGSSAYMQWPYASWGADAVLSGHDHVYERVVKDAMVYFVNGLGGRSIYQFSSSIAGSMVRFNQDYGAMLVEVWDGEVIFKFVSRAGAVIDEYSKKKTCP